MSTVIRARVRSTATSGPLRQGMAGVPASSIAAQPASMAALARDRRDAGRQPGAATRATSGPGRSRRGSPSAGPSMRNVAPLLSRGSATTSTSIFWPTCRAVPSAQRQEAVCAPPRSTKAPFRPGSTRATRPTDAAPRRSLRIVVVALDQEMLEAGRRASMTPRVSPGAVVQKTFRSPLTAGPGASRRRAAAGPSRKAAGPSPPGGCRRCGVTKAPAGPWMA